MSTNTINDALAYAVSKLGLKEFKPQQKRALESFLRGHDVFVSLPTGFGKSIIFQAASVCTDYMKQNKVKDWKTFVIVVMPIKALIRDQLEICKRLEIAAADITGGVSENIRKDLCLGNISILFTSPEFLTSESGRDFIKSEYVQEHLCGFFVDESHCVIKWGQSSGKTKAFRSSYGQLAELRSSLPRVPVVSMTATATTDVRLKVAQGLGMRNYDTVIESPDKPNIKHVMFEMNNRDFDEAFKFLIKELNNKGKDTERTILYCHSRKLVAELYAVFCSELPVSLHEHFEMYHTNTETNVQEKIIEDFALPDGQIRVLIATIAFGMGVDVKGTNTAIIVGRPTDLDDYLQMSGRIGRDGQPSTSILVRYPGDAVGKKMSASMAKYSKGQICRREIILESFSASSGGTAGAMHNCCDICASKCACSGSTCSAPISNMEELAHRSLHYTESTTEYPVLIPTPAQQDKLSHFLEDYRDSLVSEDPDHIYCGKDIASGLPQSTIEQIIRESNVNLSKYEYMRRYLFSSCDIAEKTWELYVSALQRGGEDLPDTSRHFLSKDTPSQLESDDSDLWSGDEFADAVLNRSDSESD